MSVLLENSELTQPLIERQQEHVVAEADGQSGTVVQPLGS